MTEPPAPRAYLSAYLARGPACPGVTFPKALSATLEGSWAEARVLVYVLAILFGVLKDPKLMPHGVWQGTSG